MSVALIDIGNLIGGSTSSTANIPASGDTGILLISTIDDSIVEANGSITAMVADWNGYEVSYINSSTVTVTDSVDREVRQSAVAEANQAVFSEMVGSIGARSLDTAKQRVTSTFSEGGGIGFKLGGNSTVQDLVRSSGEIINGEKWIPGRRCWVNPPLNCNCIRRRVLPIWRQQ